MCEVQNPCAEEIGGHRVEECTAGNECECWPVMDGSLLEQLTMADIKQQLQIILEKLNHTENI